MTLRVHHLNCGTLCPFCERLVAGQGRWLKRGRLVCHCLLIETPDGLVLVDTGLGRKDVAEPNRRLGWLFANLFGPRLARGETACSQIEALGFGAGDVRHILPTHLDLDHAGGLSDFPAAQVHVFAPELDQIQHPTAKEAKRFRMPQFEDAPHWVVHAAPTESWFGFDAIRPLAGVDILMVLLIGHTRGHVGIAVQAGARWKLHCGDAYYHRGQISAAPRTPPLLGYLERSVEFDRAQRLDSLARLRALAANHRDQVEIFCAHDPVEFDRVAASNPL